MEVSTVSRNSTEINGEKPEYHEYDIGNLKPDGTRSSSRLVRDSKNGKVYYTDSHYGQWKEINND